MQVDSVTWEWFRRKRSMLLPISGPMLQEKARKFALQTGDDDFKASNGWLHRFKARHNVSSTTLSGERASVDGAVVDEWQARLPNLTARYDARDIYNMDETGVVFRALPDCSLVIKGSDCTGGNKSKDRITVSPAVNVVGEFEKPLVIGHAIKPRCFRNLDIAKLPIKWHANKKAWMTTNIFMLWLNEFNRRMKSQKRHVSLFLDNAPSHPHDVTMSNVKLVYLPPNTISLLQYLDQGIIKNMKVHYRRRLLIDSCPCQDGWWFHRVGNREVHLRPECVWVDCSSRAEHFGADHAKLLQESWVQFACWCHASQRWRPRRHPAGAVDPPDSRMTAVGWPIHNGSRLRIRWCWSGYLRHAGRRLGATTGGRNARWTQQCRCEHRTRNSHPLVACRLPWTCSFVDGLTVEKIKLNVCRFVSTCTCVHTRVNQIQGFGQIIYLSCTFSLYST